MDDNGATVGTEVIGLPVMIVGLGDGIVEGGTVVDAVGMHVLQRTGQLFKAKSPIGDSSAIF